MNKELEALNKIAYSYGYDENILIINKSLKAHEEYVKNAEKEHEELMYLKSKGVQKDLEILDIIKRLPYELTIVLEAQNYEHYNKWCKMFRHNEKYRVNEQEFNLLKEWLEK